MRRCIYPFRLGEFLDHYGLSRKQFGDIIGKSLQGVMYIELRGGLNYHEHGKLCHEYGKKAVSEFYDLEAD